MQPNQNMPGVAGVPNTPSAPSTPNVSNAPSASPASNNTAAQMDAAIKAQNAQSGSNMMQSGNKNKGKGGKGTIYGMIFFAILAIAGIGFGVWTMMDGNTQKDSLNSQISTLKQQNNDLMDKISDMSEQEEEETTVIVDPSANVDTTDYIYVGEWGLKIKMPDNWKDAIDSYAYHNDYPQAVDTLAIKEKSSSDLANALLSYYGEQSCTDQLTERGMCFEINEEYYFIDFNASCSEEFVNHFKNKDIYSAI